MKSLEESFFIAMPDKISLGLLGCTDLRFSKTKLHNIEFHTIVSGNIVQQLLAKAVVLIQTSPVFYCVFKLTSYGNLALMSCSFMQIIDPIPVIEALYFFCHWPFQFEPRLSIFHSIK